MTTLLEAAQQALEALKNNAGEMRVEGAISILETALRAALAQQAEPQDAELSAALGWPGGISDPILDRKTLLRQVADLRAALAQQDEPTPPPEAVSEAEKTAYAAGWWAALAQIKGGGNLPPPLQADPGPFEQVFLTDEEILSAVGWERAEMYMKLTPNFPVEEARKETIKNARAIERKVRGEKT